MKRGKRSLSLLLACIMALAVLPGAAWAAGTGQAAPTAPLSQQMLEKVSRDLGVPENLAVEIEQSNASYWDAGERWLIQVWVYYQGKIVAHAHVDATTGELMRNIFMYTPPEEETPQGDIPGMTVDGHRYQAFHEALSWTDARAACQEMGGHLATITSAVEQKAIENYLAGIDTPKEAYWLGATDEAEEGTWTWVTGEVWSFQNWAPQEPNNDFSGTEDYLGIYTPRTSYSGNQYRWNDFTDNARSTGLDQMGYLCEWDSVADGEFRFSSNTTVNCVAKNMTFDIYAGHYIDDVLHGKDYQVTVSDDSILQINSSEWDSAQGQHLSLTAKKAGSVTLTVVDSSNNATGSLKLYVVDSETVCSFDMVPEMTVESGKTTNFYDYSGLVVDDFNYEEVKATEGSIDHYSVTMTVYNTLDLYGAVTAYSADGSIYDYCVIEKFTSMDSSFVDSLESLIKSTGDLFYLIGNELYYSGESISQKTEVSIDVPAGGYLEITNNASSPVALFANVTGITIDFMATTGSVASSSSKLLSSKSLIVDQVLLEAFTKDYAGEETVKTIKELARQELKNGDWSLNNFGDGVQSLFDVLTDSGIDLAELMAKEITSVTGIAQITESIVMNIIPTGQLIKFLYAFSDVGELIIETTVFNKSVDYPQGIYLYTSAFSDISTNAYYSDSVQWAMMNDITSGTSMSLFSPDMSCTRAQMVTFLWRAAGEPAPQSTDHPFADLQPDAYYYNAVLWAVEQGITGGTSPSAFSPNVSCTRSQAVTFLYRYAGMPLVGDVSSFEDVPNHAYYADAVTWAVENEVTSGTSATTFNPSGDCTRAQIVTFLYRVMV